MSKILINDINTQFGFKAAINEKLAQIQDEFNDKVLYRDNPIGEPNVMSSDLDMGGNDILNINKITVNDIGVVGESSFQELIVEAQAAVTAAEEQATLSGLYKDASAVSASQSATSATSAASSASAAEQSASAAAQSAAAAVPTPATTTSRGIARVATLADMGPGAVIENGPAFLAAGSAAVTTTPTAHAVPQAGEHGVDPHWLASMPCNTRTVITASGNFVVPNKGWYHVTAIGGGGAGGSCNRRGGLSGGNTTFGSLLLARGGGGGGGGSNRRSYAGGSGGGASGEIVEAYCYLLAGTDVMVTIGAGGVPSTTDGTAPTGYGAPNYQNITDNNYICGKGARGAGCGVVGAVDGDGTYCCQGGNGAQNGSGFGGGGGGAAGASSARFTPSSLADLGGAGGDNAQRGQDNDGSPILHGGNGGAGALIIDYFDPSVTS